MKKHPMLQFKVYCSLFVTYTHLTKQCALKFSPGPPRRFMIEIYSDGIEMKNRSKILYSEFRINRFRCTWS